MVSGITAFMASGRSPAIGERPDVAVSRRSWDEIHPWLPNGDLRPFSVLVRTCTLSMRSLVPPNIFQSFISTTTPAIIIVANGTFFIIILMVTFFTFNGIKGRCI